MGFAKAQMMQEDEQGWSFTSHSVCRDCVDDYALEGAIGADESSDLVCDFCGQTPLSR